MRVLLIEDEPTLAKSVELMLRSESFDVTTVEDGEAGLRVARAEQYGIILLDLNLPGMDGYNVLQQLRSRPATRDIPIVVLTAKGDEDNEVRVFELGADDFITKPFRARALSARLQAVLGRRDS